MRGQPYEISNMNGLVEEIKSFYALRKRIKNGENFHNDINDINCSWPNKRLSQLKQAINMIKNEWLSIPLHQVSPDSIDSIVN